MGTLQPKNSIGLVEQLRTSLVERMSAEDSASAVSLLHDIREELAGEIAAGRRIPEAIEKLTDELSGVDTELGFKNSTGNFLKLVTELYGSRSSVNSTFYLAQKFYDRLVTEILGHVVHILRMEGLESPWMEFALLVSGELGRGESVLWSRSGFFLIYRDTGRNDPEYIEKLANKFKAVLAVCFPVLGENLSAPGFFWYGSDAKLRKTTEELLDSYGTESSDKITKMQFSRLIENTADMRFVSGDSDFGNSVIESGKRLLLNRMGNEIFWHLAKDIAAMPVALGIFGRLRTVREGENQGKIDLNGMAIDPLAAAVRILSLHCGRIETSFAERLKSILEAGRIGVALTDRLSAAYQDFMRERIRLEFGGAGDDAGLFLDPERLDDESKERFRSGLDDVTTLQRLVHQYLVEVERE